MVKTNDDQQSKRIKLDVLRKGTVRRSNMVKVSVRNPISLLSDLLHKDISIKWFMAIPFNHRPSFIIYVDPVLWTLRIKNTETLESDLRSGPRTCARHVTVFRHTVSNFGDMKDKVFVSKLNFLLSRLKLMYWNDGIETYHEYDILTAVNREVSQIIIHEGISKMTHHVVTIFCNIKAFIWGITFGSIFDNLETTQKCGEF